MEADIMQTMKTTQEYGGINVRLNMTRNSTNVNNVILDLIFNMKYQTIKEEIIVIICCCVINVDI